MISLAMLISRRSAVTGRIQLLENHGRRAEADRFVPAYNRIARIVERAQIAAAAAKAER